MSVNAYLAQGVNAGAGMLDAARTKYNIQRDEEIRSRNAYVQDRAFNAQQDYRNATLQGQQEAAEAEHARWVVEQVKSARTPEQARAAYEWGMQDAKNRGFDVSEAPAWEQIQGMYAPPKNNAEWGRNLVTGQDPEGNPVFLQTSESGEVRPVEGYRPPGPSSKDLADAEKAETQAAEAQLKLEESIRKAEAGKATAEELAGIARSLLTVDGQSLTDDAANVFGPLQGGVYSVMGGTISAEAKIDRLTSLLTLENMDKMKGVLSDNDMKVLRAAATILNNKRIPDEVALAEIQRLAGGFEGTEGKGVGRLTPPVEGAQLMEDASGNRAWVKDGKVVKEI